MVSVLSSFLNLKFCAVCVEHTDLEIFGFSSSIIFYWNYLLLRNNLLLGLGLLWRGIHKTLQKAGSMGSQAYMPVLAGSELFQSYYIQESSNIY